MTLNSHKKGSFPESQNFPRKIENEKKNVSVCEHLVFVNMFNAHFKEKGSSYDYLVKAILSIEAAVILPLFLLSMIGLISFIQVINIDMRIKESLYEEAKYVACTSFDGNNYGIDGIKANVLNDLGNLANSYLIDTERGGIDFSESEFTNPEVIFLNVKLNIKIPFLPTESFRYTFTERVVIHTWIGYKEGLEGSYYQGEMVYITSGSEVYHKSLECSHIRLSITETNPEEIKYKRNADGERYLSCNLCHSRKSDSKLYITRDGNKYHNTLLCSGLKRTIRAVPLYSVKDRRPCLRCGY